MKKRTAIQIIGIRIIGAILPILVTAIFCMCTSESNAQMSQGRYGLYKDGMYRHFLTEIQSEAKTSGLDNLFIARSYQRMQLQTNALQSYAKANWDTGDTATKTFLKDIATYYYALALFNTYTNLPTFKLEDFSVIEELIKHTDRNGVYFSEVMRTYFFYLWKKSEYRKIASFSANHPLAETYRLYAEFMLSPNATKLSEILAKPLDGIYYSVVSDFLKKVGENIQSLNAKELDILYSRALNYGEIALAEKYLARYYAVAKDIDYYTRNLNRLLYTKGKKSEAIAALEKFIQSGNASDSTKALLISYLRAMGNYKRISALVFSWGKGYFRDYITAMDKQSRATELYNWAMKEASDVGFLKTHSSQVFQILLRNNPSLAKAFVEKALSVAKLPTLRLYSALFDLTAGKTETAYRQFLDILLYSHFDYEWVVAKKYEAQYRREYRTLYDNALFTKRESLKGALESDMLHFWLVMENIDKDYYHKNANTANTLAMQNRFTDKAVAGFPRDEGVNKELAPYFKVSDEIIESLGEEYADFIHKKVNSNALMAGIIYDNQDFYKRLGQSAVVVTRLNYYFWDNEIHRGYHPFYTESLQKAIYPIDDLELIDSLVTNRNNSLWYLSVFREESHFRKNVGSWAGAWGYSQLMRATADVIKNNAKHPEWSIYDFYDNLRIGILFINYLFRRYGKVIPALAAYNAGEPAVNRWLKKYNFDNELWVECIEYDETRNYVKKILLTRFFYDRLYGERILE